MGTALLWCSHGNGPPDPVYTMCFHLIHILCCRHGHSVFYLFVFLHMGVIPACISVNHVHAWWLWRLEDGVRCLGTRVMDSGEAPCGSWEPNCVLWKSSQCSQLRSRLCNLSLFSCWVWLCVFWSCLMCLTVMSSRWTGHFIIKSPSATFFVVVVQSALSGR